MMIITYISSPAKAIRVALLLSCVILFAKAGTTNGEGRAAAVVGSTRNIVSKKEATVTSSSSSVDGSSSSSQQDNRSLMIGMNEMVCNESIETKDGSIVCSFRIMPPTIEKASNLIHDCLFSPTMGDNFCITSEVSRSTFTDANQGATTNGQAVINEPTPIVLTEPQQDTTTTTTTDGRVDDGGTLFVDTPIPPIVTIDAELSSVVVPAPAPAPVPAPAPIPSRTDTIQIPTPVNGSSCPPSLPKNGDVCRWLDTPQNHYSTYQCGYLTGDEVPQLPGTQLLVCKCDVEEKFVCALAGKEVLLGQGNNN